MVQQLCLLWFLCFALRLAQKGMCLSCRKLISFHRSHVHFFEANMIKHDHNNYIYNIYIYIYIIDMLLCYSNLPNQPCQNWKLIRLQVIRLFQVPPLLVSDQSDVHSEDKTRGPGDAQQTWTWKGTGDLVHHTDIAKYKHLLIIIITSQLDIIIINNCIFYYFL